MNGNLPFEIVAFDNMGCMGKRLLILGAGGHGKVVREVALSIVDENNKPVYEAIDFLDDNATEAVGKISDLEKFANNYDEAFCGIGNNNVRKNILDQIKKSGLSIPVLIHPSAYISATALVEEGTVIEPKAIVNTNSIIHKGCIISVGSIVDHDVEVGEFSHVNAGAIVKAGARIVSGRKLEAGEVVMGYDASKR